VVSAVIAAGFRVIPLPGASALICALMAAGVTDDQHPEFMFAGFAPSKAMARQKWLKRWVSQPQTLIFYETPHRIAASLKDLFAVAGPDRKITLARELTKRFEQICTISLGDAETWIAEDAHREQGEYVVILHPEPLSENQADAEHEAAASVDHWIDAMLPLVSVRDIAKIISQATGLTRDSIYARTLARAKAQ
jgi:16S rRNA (cytidine1402-2'-O)-methyltransferase